FLSPRRRHTSSLRDWSSDVCSSDLYLPERQVFVESFRRQPLDRTRQQRDERPARGIGTADAAVEVRGHAAAIARVLEQAEIVRQIGRASCREGVWIWVVAR